MLGAGTLPRILERGPRGGIGALPRTPERVSSGHPVEEEKSQNSPEKRRNRAQAIADIAHYLALGTQILHFAELQRSAPAAAHHPPS